MASEIKSIADFERETGRHLLDLTGVSVNKKVTLDEFTELADSRDCILLDYEGRVEWLKANGYEVNRDNLTNRELVANPQEDQADPDSE